MTTYAEFLHNKTQLGGEHGFEPLWMHYLATLRSLYPKASTHQLQTSPQFQIYSGQMRARAWTRNNSVNDGTLAKVFEQTEPKPFLKNRMCAKCGLVFFATHSPFCRECISPPCGERHSPVASVSSRAEGTNL